MNRRPSSSGVRSADRRSDNNNGRSSGSSASSSKPILSYRTFLGVRSPKASAPDNRDKGALNKKDDAMTASKQFTPQSSSSAPRHGSSRAQQPAHSSSTSSSSNINNHDSGNRAFIASHGAGVTIASSSGAKTGVHNSKHVTRIIDNNAQKYLQLSQQQLLLQQQQQQQQRKQNSAGSGSHRDQRPQSAHVGSRSRSRSRDRQAATAASSNRNKNEGSSNERYYSQKQNSSPGAPRHGAGGGVGDEEGTYTRSSSSRSNALNSSNRSSRPHSRERPRTTGATSGNYIPNYARPTITQTYQRPAWHANIPLQPSTKVQQVNKSQATSTVTDNNINSNQQQQQQLQKQGPSPSPAPSSDHHVFTRASAGFNATSPKNDGATQIVYYSSKVSKTEQLVKSSVDPAGSNATATTATAGSNSSMSRGSSSRSIPTGSNTSIAAKQQHPTSSQAQAQAQSASSKAKPKAASIFATPIEVITPSALPPSVTPSMSEALSNPTATSNESSRAKVTTYTQPAGNAAVIKATSSSPSSPAVATAPAIAPASAKTQKQSSGPTAIAVLAAAEKAKNREKERQRTSSSASAKKSNGDKDNGDNQHNSEKSADELPTATADEREHLQRLLVSTRPKDRSSTDFYSFGKVVGVGSFAKVRVARHKLTGQHVAIKTYEKAKIKDPNQWRRIQQEIKLMERLDHPLVIRLFETVESSRRIHLVMEYLGTSNLCTHVKAKRKLHEEEARRIFSQIAQGLEYMHVQSIIHRDIKLENVLFDEDHNAKLIDFGFSVQCKDKKLKVFCGTPSYMAPEIVKRTEYKGKPVDIWSLGVVLYAMLSGCFPFSAKTYPDLYKKIIKGHFRYPESFSPSLRDLISNMLRADPNDRFTVQQCRSHPWTQQFAPKSLKCTKAAQFTVSKDPRHDVYREVLDRMMVLGINRDELVSDIMHRKRNSLTSCYYLLAVAMRMRTKTGGLNS